MITIVQYTKYENTYFFFAEGSKKALSVNTISELIESGLTDLSHEQFNEIVEG